MSCVVQMARIVEVILLVRVIPAGRTFPVGPGCPNCPGGPNRPGVAVSPGMVRLVRRLVREPEDDSNARDPACQEHAEFVGYDISSTCCHCLGEEHCCQEKPTAPDKADYAGSSWRTACPRSVESARAATREPGVLLSTWLNLS